MGISKRTKPRASKTWLWLLFLWFACSCALHGRATEAAVAEEKNNDNNDSFDEDELVQETIQAGRGDRDEPGVRDQWLSEEHIGSTFDSRMPISQEVQRLLTAYRLTCEGCDHKQAVRKLNEYNRETRKLARLEKKRQQQTERNLRNKSWLQNLLMVLLVGGLSAAYVYRETTKRGLDFLVTTIETKLGQKIINRESGDDLRGFTEAQKANILRLRRQQAANAATQRQQPSQESTKITPPPPTWLENEQTEVWNSKQEKQFQKALREFSGVPKKERYKLIAEKVVGKSRIECLTHHRMIELIAKRQQEQEQQGQQ